MTGALRVLTPREASIFACLVDTIVAPAPPLPPVHATDATTAFDAWLARAPRPNRAAFRTMLYAAEVGPRAAGFGRRMRRLEPGQRLEYVRRAERARLPGARQAAEAIRAAAAVCYYGDLEVMRTLGYEPRARPPAAR